jgi:CDP-diacylglycerol--glycerol-3-phosphate 3-phosphatidyltransferase
MIDRRAIVLGMTWGRVWCVPLLLLAFYGLPYTALEQSTGPICCFIFSAAALSDWLDGFYARKWGVESRFGAFLDPVADKLMVVASLLVLVQHDPRLILVIPAIIIISREMLVSALREWLAQENARDVVAVRGLSKLKTIFQMTAVGFLLYRNDTLFWPIFGLGVYDSGLILLLIATVLTVWSMWVYLRAAWPRLMAGGA